MYRGHLPEREDSEWYVTYDKQYESHVIHHRYLRSDSQEQWPIEHNFKWVIFL